MAVGQGLEDPLELARPVVGQGGRGEGDAAGGKGRGHALQHIEKS